MSDKLKTTLAIWSILLLLWNPVVLWLYFKSITIAIAVPAIIIAVGTFVMGFNNLRAKAWMFNICAILSILFQAEAIFDIVYSDKEIPNLYELRGSYYFNRPYLDRKFTDAEYVSRYRTNVQGYRIDDLVDPEKKVEKCDWLFIGDSFTQGAQVDYKDLFSTLLYGKNPDKVIVNAGISGAGLYDELNYFKHEGKKLSPKIVFLQIGAFNDFMNIVEHKANFQDYLMEYSSLYRYLEFNITNREELPLGRWTEPFCQNKEDNIDNNIFFKQTSDIKETDKRIFRDCIIEFKNEVEKCGGELVLIFIPSKEQVSDRMLSEVLKTYNIKRDEIDLTIPNKLCESIAKELGITLFDMYPEFKASLTFPFFMLDEHMNAIGHSLIANKIGHIGENSVEYISRTNSHERYPTIYSDSIVLCQSQDEDFYYLEKKFLKDNSYESIWKGVSELIHPVMTMDNRYLAFTEGDQEMSETDVLLYDFLTNEQDKLNTDGCYAAIPTFSNDNGKVVFPEWSLKDKNPKITIYDINSKKKSSFADGVECWRPIFSRDDSQVLYIQKTNKNDKFIVKSHNLTTGSNSILLNLEYDIWDIALSPSGNYLAYAGNKDGNWDLFLYSFVDKSIRQLTHTIGDEWDPSFGTTDTDLWFAGVFGFNDGIFHMTIK